MDVLLGATEFWLVAHNTGKKCFKCCKDIQPKETFRYVAETGGIFCAKCSLKGDHNAKWFY